MPGIRTCFSRSSDAVTSASVLMCLCVNIPGGAANASPPPYRLDWRTDAAIVVTTLASGAAATAVSGDDALTEAEVRGLSRSDVNWLDRSATYRYSRTLDLASTALVGAGTLTPLILAATPGVRQDWVVVGGMYLEAWFMANWVPDICKGAIDRVRPYLYNPEAPLDEKLSDSSARRSFYSGHTTLAFATATFGVTVLRDYYARARWASRTERGLLLAAAGVGGLRYAAGEHYPSDVLVGAVVGSAIGCLVPRLHRRHGEARLVLVPARPATGRGLSLRWGL